jgi:hypothetical protein
MCVIKINIHNDKEYPNNISKYFEKPKKKILHNMEAAQNLIFIISRRFRMNETLKRGISEQFIF